MINKITGATSTQENCSQNVVQDLRGQFDKAPVGKGGSKRTQVKNLSISTFVVTLERPKEATHLT